MLRPSSPTTSSTVPGDFNLSNDEEIMAVVNHARDIHTLYKITI